jgi:hypothetical protein
MNSQDFRMLPQEMKFGFHIVTNQVTLLQNPRRKYCQKRRQQLLQRGYDKHIFAGTKCRVLDVLPREEKINQHHCLAMIIRESSKRNTNAKR